MGKSSSIVPIFNKNYSTNKVFFALLNTKKPWRMLHSISSYVLMHATIKGDRSLSIWLQKADSWNDWQLPTTITATVNNIHGNCQQHGWQLPWTVKRLVLTLWNKASYCMKTMLLTAWIQESSLPLFSNNTHTCCLLQEQLHKRFSLVGHSVVKYSILEGLL